MNTKKTKINITNNPNKSFTQASFIQSSENHYDKAGELFILTEINEASKKAKKINFIIKQLLEKNYYLNKEILLLEKINSLKIESIFEMSLVKTNRELLEFIDQEKINFNFKNLSIIVGLIHEEQLYFSSIGKNKSFLIKKTDENSDISDINPDGEKEGLRELSSGKIFSSIINGKLPDNSYIVFTNDSLAQYLLNEDFIKILEKLNIEGAGEQIKNSLKEINNYSNFCGILIKKEEQRKSPNIHLNTENDLEETKNKTEKILTNPGSVNKKKLCKKTKECLNKINISKFISKITKKIKKRKKKTNIDNTIFKSKNKIKKPLIIISILLLILIVSSYYQKNKKKVVIEKEKVSEIMEDITQIQGQIESSLLYNNEEEARKKISKLRDILESLNEGEKDLIENYSDIKEKLEKQLEKIQKLTRIEDPEEKVNFKTLNAEADIEAFSFIDSEKKIYAIDKKNNSIHIFNLNDSSYEESVNELITGNIILSSDKDNNGNINFLVKDHIIKIDSKGEKSFDKIETEDLKNIKSFDVYNDNYYFLNETGEEILVYKNSKLSPWIKDNSRPQAVDIAIDYYVYTLGSDGKIKKYLSGNKQDFENDLVDPLVEKAKTIRSSENYLFILEPEKQRFLVYTKDNGVFSGQYQSSHFNNLKDIIISENEKNVYLLNENTIYEISLKL
jgi:hypothetical protein